LRPQIAVEATWTEIGTVARRLIDREFTGKAVLHVAYTAAGENSRPSGGRRISPAASLSP